MSLAKILHVLDPAKPAAVAESRKSNQVTFPAPVRKAAKPVVVAKSRKSNQVPFSWPVGLRELGAGDFENWRQAYSMLGAPRNKWDEGPWKQAELTLPKFRALLKEQARLRRLDQQYTYGVFRKDDGVFVGFVSFMDIGRGIFQNGYLGYRIFNPYWGRGYATYAVRLAIDIAFKELKLHRIEAGISPDNKASIQVVIKAGLVCEGLSRKRLLVDRKWVDLLLFAGTCEDFGRRFRK